MIEIEKILDAQRTWQSAPADDNIAISKMVVESLEKCAAAINVLSNNLREIGYTWTQLEKTTADLLAENISTIERTIESPIPQVLIMFWEKVGSVSFVDLKNYKHVDFWKEHKIVAPKYFCDGLYVGICNDEWASFVCNDFIDWKKYNNLNKSDGFLLSLSPDGYHKDNISGGAPYGVYPEVSWKPIWQNFEWSGVEYPFTASASSPDFLSYLRTTILECAGFPAFLGLPNFKPIKDRLLQGVPVF